MSELAPIIEIDDLSYWYEPRALGEPVLEDVTLHVEADDFLGVIGPNGGGKTTLLKVILGLVKPQRGRVRVLGQAPQSVRPQIGYVPQQAWIDLAAPADVLDVVLMGRLSQSTWGCRYGGSHVSAALVALEQVGMRDLAKRRIGALSGGQRQRVLIARALAQDAKILLLDEPTAGVDAHMARSLTDLLHRLNETMPIVLVSHDVTFVSTHLKRVACLNRRLTCHAATEISAQVISEMYHGEVRLIRHADSCPLADPGCHHECAEPSEQSTADALAEPRSQS